MESLSNETFDVVIAGTSLSQSLLALALSKCDVKVLHVDKNDYYGGIDAGLSLSQAQKWADSREDAAVIETDDTNSDLGPSRIYTISLKPQIIYAKSRFLPTLVSSQIHTQLEFQAVGSFWIHADGNLRKIPNNREDVFDDDTIPVRDKRRLMGLLRYVVEEQDEGANTSDTPSTLEVKLTNQFKIPHNLMPPVQALTLSTARLRNTSFDDAMTRLKRHLLSMGYFGQGLAAVMAKYGGNSEIAQVACRAGAVGGFVYLLGHGISSVNLPAEMDSLAKVELSDGTAVKTKHVVGMRGDLPLTTTSNLDGSRGHAATRKVAHRISIISKPLRHLFTSSETATVPAVAIILVDAGDLDLPPVYLQVHSGDTGECPDGQCIIYASTHRHGVHSQERLASAVSNVITTLEESQPPQVLWTMAFTLDEAAGPTGWNYYDHDEAKRVIVLPERAHDLAFDDTILDNVKDAWEIILDERSTEYDFLRFEERKDINEDD